MTSEQEARHSVPTQDVLQIWYGKIPAQKPPVSLTKDSSGLSGTASLALVGRLGKRNEASGSVPRRADTPLCYVRSSPKNGRERSRWRKRIQGQINFGCLPCPIDAN